MKTSRRTFLTGVGAIAATAASQNAHAQNVLDSILGSPRRGWNDQFDAQMSTAGDVATTRPIFHADTAAYVQSAIFQYQTIVANGGWPMVPDQKKLELGVVDPDVETLRRRLMISGDLAEAAGMSQSFDTYVDAAMKRFQARHGIPADGVTGPYTYRSLNATAPVRLGQLETNLQRLIEAGTPQERYVMVNIPAAQIEAAENGRVVSRHTAVVGKIDRQTPILNSRIHEIIINPYWNAPESIVRRDIIPLVRENPSYLEENGIRILGPDGQEVDPMTINWQTEEAARLRFRQDPGKINAMASVKINFPNSHAVYMHDTPQQSLFADQERFHSSGCVRVQNVRDLVTWILRDTPGWDRGNIERTIQTGADVPVPVANPVPVHFSYISAWSSGDGIVQFRDDIYGMDGSSQLQISSAI